MSIYDVQAMSYWFFPMTGIDTIRPSDNGALCGGGAFETKGCAENDCSVSSVNNGGSETSSWEGVHQSPPNKLVI